MLIASEHATVLHTLCMMLYCFFYTESIRSFSHADFIQNIKFVGDSKNIAFQDVQRYFVRFYPVAAAISLHFIKDFLIWGSGVSPFYRGIYQSETMPEKRISHI